jgi:hypothetical protein
MLKLTKKAEVDNYTLAFFQLLSTHRKPKNCMRNSIEALINYSTRLGPTQPHLIVFPLRLHLCECF